MKTPYMRDLVLKDIRTLIDCDVGKAKRNFLLEIREAFPLMLVPVMNQNTLGFCGCLPAHFRQTPCMTIFFVKGKQNEGIVLTELQDFSFFLDR